MRNLRKHIALTSRAMAVVAAVAMLLSLPSCGGGRVPQSLVEADSLMNEAPDSALSLLLALSDDSLPSKEAHAYQALLVTQAMYKCYLSFDSDSLINVALDYYKHHGDRDKLTRALTYKGAVMEELGDASAAIEYYKQAEYAADPNDHENLGYIYLRMASLYDSYFESEAEIQSLYEKALSQFRLSGNKMKQFNCLYGLGKMYCLNSTRKSNEKFEEALEIANELNDTDCMVGAIMMRANNFLRDSLYDEAKSLSVGLINRFPENVKETGTFLVAADAYIGLGMIDSALYMIDLDDKCLKVTPVHRVQQLHSKSNIALLLGETEKYAKLHQEHNRLSDSIEYNNTKVELLQAKESSDAAHLQQKEASHYYDKRNIVCVSLLILIVLGGFLYTYHKRLHRYDKLISTLRDKEANTHNELLQATQNETYIQRVIEGQVETIRKLIATTNISSYKDASQKIHEVLTSQNISGDITFSTSLFKFVDTKYNNLISETREKFPNLKHNDLLLIALTACGFSYIESAICLGYSNPSYISGKKQRIAKAMNLNESLNDYIKRYQS